MPNKSQIQVNYKKDKNKSTREALRRRETPEERSFQPRISALELEKMKFEIERIRELLKDVNQETPDNEFYKKLNIFITVLNETILDSSKDFYEIGGFGLLIPLLSVPDNKTVANTAELIGDLCQNNAFNQKKAMEINLLPVLEKILRKENKRLFSTGLYAMSYLCRNNEEAMKQLESKNINPHLMQLIQTLDDSELFMVLQENDS